jgi:hypothetical protein
VVSIYISAISSNYYANKKTNKKYISAIIETDEMKEEEIDKG